MSDDFRVSRIESGLSVLATDLDASIASFRDASGDEILSFDQDGNIYVHGRLAGNDAEVVSALRRWAVSLGLR